MIYFCLDCVCTCDSGHRFTRKENSKMCIDLCRCLIALRWPSTADRTLNPIIYNYHHQSLNHDGRWGTKDDFATSFLHFPLFPTALWNLANSRPVHSLMLPSHLFLCPPCLLLPFTVPCKMAVSYTHLTLPTTVPV